MPNQSQEAKQFASLLQSFVDVADKISATEDADAAFAAAELRLTNKKHELEKVVEGVRSANLLAEDTVAKGQAAAAKKMDEVRRQADKIIEDAQMKAHQLITNATGDAEAKKLALERTVRDLEIARDRAASESDEAVRNREAVRASVEAAKVTLKSLQSEIAAIKERLSL